MGRGSRGSTQIDRTGKVYDPLIAQVTAAPARPTAISAGDS